MSSSPRSASSSRDWRNPAHRLASQLGRGRIVSNLKAAARQNGDAMTHMLRALLVLAAILLDASAPVHADSDGDHDRARELYEHGAIQSLAQILRDLRQCFPGDIVSIDLVPVEDSWIYRFQIVDADGRRFTVDAPSRDLEEHCRS